MQEAWVSGYWDDAVEFFRGLFNSTFKTNAYMECGLITGITRISKESIFSDFNNLKVVTTISDAYATSFGFTEEEVFEILDDMGLGHEKQGVKKWYDSFTFGSQTDIYNPWSIISFISEKGKYKPYWSNTSGNGLVNTLIQEGDTDIKRTMEELLRGSSFETHIDEQIVFEHLNGSTNAVWSLLLATGYLKVLHMEPIKAGDERDALYTLALTNFEVKKLFRNMVKSWFENYHGLVLGLIVELEGRFQITSNRESGFGRYDVMLNPADRDKDDAYIIEFKVHKLEKEKDLQETLANALAQIESKRYDADLTASGIEAGRIRKYGFAFKGKGCLIGACT